MHERQKRFVQEYITNGHNAYRAALDAGYTKNTAIACSAKMPTNPTVKPLLDKAMAVADRVLELDLGITIKTKGQWLLQLIEDVLDPNDPKRDYYKDAIKAIQETLGHTEDGARQYVNGITRAMSETSANS